MSSASAVSLSIPDILSQRLRDRTARVGIIGLGYVGCPLAVELGRAGYSVTGFDVQRSKVDTINSGRSHIQDVSGDAVEELVKARKLVATTDFAGLQDLDAVSICVPTPLRKTKDPDMSYVVAACAEIAKYVHPGMLIILESTTYPGTTDELLLPMLKQSGLQVGQDFFLCFSPERVDPGNPTYQTANIPKVIGGVTPSCTELGALFYSNVMQRVVPVSSTRVAEMVKLLENTFRMINIGLVNEIAMMCDRIEIDVWEVIDAAATKPFGFMPFYPGPGLGGHCIPIDPFYLSWKTKQAGIEARFIDLAGYINGQMPHFVVDKIQNALNDHTKPLRSSHVHVLGVTYKKDIDDVRESPALDVIQVLMKKGVQVTFSDPRVEQIRLEDGGVLRSADLLETSAQADCVVIVTDHSKVDYGAVLEKAKLVVDTRNALKGHKSNKIVRL